MTATTAVVRPSLVLDDDALGAIGTWNDALNMIKTADVPLENVADYGTGFSVLKDKTKLVNVPFLILEWATHESDSAESGEFTSMTIVTRNDEKYIVNDGSTGIAKQLARVARLRLESGQYDEKSARQALYVGAGLTRSDYKTTDAAGKQIEATTFYLAD